MQKLLLKIIILAFFTTATAYAGQVETPTTLEGVKIVGTAEAKALLDDGARFFDTRSPLNFGKGHIPGASSLPYKEKSAKKIDFDASLDQMESTKLPIDKKEKIVFYSHGPTGWKSYKAAVLSLREGHENVFWYRNGLEEWEKTGQPQAR